MYQFENIVGNTAIITSLQSAILNNKISHCYILDGEVGIGKKTIANTFAKALQCEVGGVNPCGKCVSCKSFESGNHTDIVKVGPVKNKSIGVDDVREQVNEVVSIKPYRSKYKIFIIDNGELITVQGQNAMLKTIEEPPSYVIFLIMTNNSKSFLPTILSRAVLLKLRPLTKEIVQDYLLTKVDMPIDDIEMYAAFSSGNIGKALTLMENEEFKIMRDEVIEIMINLIDENLVDSLLSYSFFEKNKNNIDQVLDIMSIWYRDVLIYNETKNMEYILQKDRKNDIISCSEKLTSQNLIKKIEYIKEVTQSLESYSNFQITMEVMCLKLKEK